MLGFGHSSRQGAKTPSSERKTPCHFDQREKSLFRARREIFFLAPSHLPGMTGLGPSPLRLGVFAGDNPISAFAFFAPFAVNDPDPNPLWLRLSRAVLKSRLPSMYSRREAVEAGGLMSYGADLGDNYPRGGRGNRNEGGSQDQQDAKVFGSGLESNLSKPHVSNSHRPGTSGFTGDRGGSPLRARATSSAALV